MPYHRLSAATKWTTLTEFVMHLGKTGKCKIEDSPKGWILCADFLLAFIPARIYLLAALFVTRATREGAGLSAFLCGCCYCCFASVSCQAV